MGRDASQSARGRRVDAVDDPDAPLVRAIAQGDQRAVRALVDRHMPRMTAIAVRMLSDRTEADDVVQEVFLRVWRHAGTWTPGAAKFETWMCRVAMNLCYDRLRRRREVLTDEPPERADEGPGAFDAVHAGDVAARVRAAIAALPERQRAAITLCHFEGMTNIAAAEVLEVSVEALESLLSRGRRALRAALSDEAGALLEAVDGARG